MAGRRTERRTSCVGLAGDAGETRIVHPSRSEVFDEGSSVVSEVRRAVARVPPARRAWVATCQAGRTYGVGCVGTGDAVLIVDRALGTEAASAWEWTKGLFEEVVPMSRCRQVPPVGMEGCRWTCRGGGWAGAWVRIVIRQASLCALLQDAEERS